MGGWEELEFGAFGGGDDGAESASALDPCGATLALEVERRELHFSFACGDEGQICDDIGVDEGFAVVFAGVDFGDFAAQKDCGGDSHSVVDGALDLRGESGFGGSGEMDLDGGRDLRGLFGELQDGFASCAGGFGGAVDNHLGGVSAVVSAQFLVVCELSAGELVFGKGVFPLSAESVDEVVPVVHMHFQREEVWDFGEDLVEEFVRGGAGVASLRGEEFQHDEGLVFGGGLIFLRAGGREERRRNRRRKGDANEKDGKAHFFGFHRGFWKKRL